MKSTRLGSEKKEHVQFLRHFFCTLASKKHRCERTLPWASVFEPRVGGDGRFAAVAVIVQQLLPLVDVPRGHENEVRGAVDVVEFGLAVPVFAVVDQATHPARLSGGVHAARKHIEIQFVFIQDNKSIKVQICSEFCFQVL